MRKRELMVVAMVISFLVPLVSAGVYFSQPEDTYNLGDIIESNLEISPIEEGPLEVNLNCDGTSILASYGNPDSSESVKLPLNFLFLNDIKGGDCMFIAKYGDGEYQSRNFKISNALNIQLGITNLVVKPGDNITISGTANRLNGVGISGDVEINIPLLSLMASVQSVQSEDSENSEEFNGGEDIDEVSKEIEGRINESGEGEGDKDSYQNETNIEIEENKEELVESDDQSIVEKADTGTFYGSVIDGAFSLTLYLPHDIPAGNYRIDVHAFEKLEGVITSEGIEFADLQVLPILSGIDVAIGEQSIDPGNVFNFRPMLLDQTGASLIDDVSVIITNEQQERIYEKIHPSEDTANFNVPTNLTSGYYDVHVSHGDFEIFKNFYVKEKRMVSFDLLNDTLFVTNIGNIPYDKDFEIELNGKPFVRKLNLGLGEVQKFKLTGNGEYNIKIGDGETEIVRRGVSLTGHAVDVKAIRESTLLLSTPLVWIFIILILGAGALFLFRNVLKEKSFAYPFKGKFKKKFKVRFFRSNKKATSGQALTSLEKIGEKDEKGANAPRSLMTPNEAEHVLVLTGQKNQASVIGLRIKNSLSKESVKGLNAIIEKVTSNKGVVYISGQYRFIILSPLITRSFKNDSQAAKIAELLQILLKKYNRMFKDKIEFGIGVGGGEIVNKIENGKLKFTHLGSFMALIKKLAESSEEKVLITKDSYERSGEIKGGMIHVNGSDVYELKRVVDYEANQKFIQGFLERMEKEKK